ncbi:hypothetical protein ES704_01405 [subsurface metagenome]
MDKLITVDKKSRKLIVNQRLFAYGIGFGLVLFAVHNSSQPGLEYAFLPVVGLAIVIVSVALSFVNLKGKPDFGPRYIYIPMLVIIASVIARLFIEPTMQTVGSILLLASLFAVYVASRHLGKAVFIAFIPAVVIEGISCIVEGLITPGARISGIIASSPNYCIATGFIVFGTVVAMWKWQWALVPLALVALFFTGSPEALFVIAVLGIVVLARRDWSKRLLIPVGLLAIVAITWIGLGYGTELYSYAANKIETVITNPTEGNIDEALTGRWHVIKRAMNNLRPLGEGLSITEYSTDTVHNVPLVIVQQLGIAAALAWLFVSISCLVKTKWKYAWVAVLALSVFDHYIWTQLAPYWWALVGVSTVSNIKSDLIFRKGGLK